MSLGPPVTIPGFVRGQTPTPPRGEGNHRRFPKPSRSGLHPGRPTRPPSAGALFRSCKPDPVIFPGVPPTNPRATRWGFEWRTLPRRGYVALPPSEAPSRADLQALPRPPRDSRSKMKLGQNDRRSAHPRGSHPPKTDRSPAACFFKPAAARNGSANAPPEKRQSGTPSFLA